MIGTSPPGPLRCGSTICRGKAVAPPASKALPPRSRIPMPTAVAIQCVLATTPNVPSISGRVGNRCGLIKLISMTWFCVLRSDFVQLHSADRPNDSIATRLSICRSPKVARSQSGISQHVFDRLENVGRRGLLPEMIQHHGARPDLPNGVRDALTGDVGRGPVHRLEQRWKIAFRVDVARRRNANGARAGRPKVREDVAEEVRGDHDIE